MDKQVNIEGYLNASTPYISLDTRDSLKVIMTKETNPAMLAVLYAKGLCAHEDYMTLAEALAVTNELIDALLLDNNTVYSFNEFKYFTGVTSIGDGGFARNCGTLESITFPKSLIEIGENALSISTASYNIGVRSKLLSVKGIENVEIIKRNAFLYAELLTKLDFSNKLTTVNTSAFLYTFKLLDVGDFSNVITIGTATFWGSEINSIDLPKITEIPESLFCNCKNISFKNLNIIWENLTSIGSQGFMYSSIDKVPDLPNLTSFINRNNFKGCELLTEVGDIPKITSLTTDCFGSCYNLEKIGDLSSVVTIGRRAFMNTKLKDLEMPSATTIVMEAFADADLSGEVYFPIVNSVGLYAFGIEDKTDVVRTIKFGLSYESITFHSEAFIGNTKTTIICNNVELTPLQYTAVGATKPL